MYNFPIKHHSMTDPVSELPAYQIKVAPLQSEYYKARVDLQLPAIDMGRILEDLEDLFKYCAEKYGKIIYCMDLSLLTENLQMEYLQHMLHVSGIVQSYFTSGDSRKENGNYVLAYGFASYLETVINVALAVSPNHNVRLVTKENLDAKVAELAAAKAV